VRTAWRSERVRWRLTDVSLRVGNTGASPTWGVSARLADVARLGGLRFGVAVDVWRQPELLAEQTSDPQSVGGGAIANTILPLPRKLRASWLQGIYVAAGYRTQGYVPGEQLSGGAVVRAGVALR
jgi:hypothetical protein